MTIRTRQLYPVLFVLCLGAALAAWSCGEAGSPPGTPAGPSLTSPAAQAGQATPSAPSSSTDAARKAPPDAAVVTMMTTAIQDEFHAFYTYTRVNADLGDPKPFVSIVNAEDQHVNALAKQFTKYGLDVPTSVWDLDNVPTFANLKDACTGGVLAENENIAMYESFFDGGVTLPDEVAKVFDKLMRASADNHLPSFERCAAK